MRRPKLPELRKRQKTSWSPGKAGRLPPCLTPSGPSYGGFISVALSSRNPKPWWFLPAVPGPSEDFGRWFMGPPGFLAQPKFPAAPQAIHEAAKECATLQCPDKIWLLPNKLRTNSGLVSSRSQIGTDSGPIAIVPRQPHI